MNILKVMTRVLSIWLFSLAVVTLAIGTALVVVFSNPTTIKSSIKSSNVYNTFTDSLVYKIAKDNGGTVAGITVSQPAVRSAAQKALPPQFIEQSTTTVIDSSYDWLNGKTKSLSFNIDLSVPKQQFASSLGDYAVTRAQGLPACTYMQLRSLQGTSINPFEVPCMPPGVDILSIRDQAEAKIINNTDFISQPNINLDTIKASSKEPSTFGTNNSLPTLYRYLKVLPIISGIVALLSALLVIWLSVKRKKGIYTLSSILLGTGLMLLVLVGVTHLVLNKLPLPSDHLAQSLSYVIRSLTVKVNQLILIFGGVYSVLGILGMVYYLRSKKATKSADSSASYTRTN